MLGKAENIMKPLRIVVVGTLASNPYAGMAWMHMQITAGLHRLGHDAYYFETTSTWPYDPVRQMKVCDSEYSVPYLARVAESFGLSGRCIGQAARKFHQEKARGRVFAALRQRARLPR